MTKPADTLALDPTAEFVAELPRVEGFPVLGRYLLCKMLGAGGAGAVYMGYHVKLQQPVAIKILNPTLIGQSEAAVQRFNREAILASMVKSPHVVKVTDAATWRKPLIHHIVMDLVDGENAQERIERLGRPLSVSEACTICMYAARGLAAAHACRIIHRDLKPANIMISRKGEVLLADLGIATSVERPNLQVTRTEEFIGTPHYMAPEHVRGEDLDERADVYSLGVTLFHLLTAELPFAGPTAFTVMRRVETESLPDARTIRPDVPDRVAKLIAAAAAANREHRVPSAESLLSQLETVVHQTGGPAHLADPEAGGDRAARFVELTSEQLSHMGREIDQLERSAGSAAPARDSRTRTAALLALIVVLSVGGFWMIAGGGESPLEERILAAEQAGDSARLLELLQLAIASDALPEAARRTLWTRLGRALAQRIDEQGGPSALAPDDHDATVIAILLNDGAQIMVDWIVDELESHVRRGEWDEVHSLLALLDAQGVLLPQVVGRVAPVVIDAVRAGILQRNDREVTSSQHTSLQILARRNAADAGRLLTVADGVFGEATSLAAARAVVDAARSLGLVSVIDEPLAEMVEHRADRTSTADMTGWYDLLLDVALNDRSDAPRIAMALENLYARALANGRWDAAYAVLVRLETLHAGNRERLVDLGTRGMEGVRSSIVRSPLGEARTPTGEPLDLLDRIDRLGVRGAALLMAEFLVEWTEDDVMQRRSGIEEAWRGRLQDFLRRALLESADQDRLRASYLLACAYAFDVTAPPGGGDKFRATFVLLHMAVECPDAAARIIDIIGQAPDSATADTLILEYKEAAGVPFDVAWKTRIRPTLQMAVEHGVATARVLFALGYGMCRFDGDSARVDGFEFMVQSAELNFWPALNAVEIFVKNRWAHLTPEQRQRLGW